MHKNTKMKNKKILYLYGYLLFLVSLSNVYSQSDLVPAQDPNDGVFKIKLKNGNEACVYANESEGVIYPQIDYISSSVCDEKNNGWRYDVFNRLSIAVRVPDDKSKIIYLCLMEKVELKDGKWQFPKFIVWDYAVLSPCVTNDPRQQWRFVEGKQEGDDAIVNVATGHTIGEVNWTLATENNFGKNLNHFTLPRNQSWFDTKAEPRDFSHVLDLQWYYNGKYYRTFGDSSGVLRYNPSTQQISRVDKLYLYCLTSNLVGKPESTHWAWATWEKCGDDSAPDSQTWRVNSVYLPSNIKTVPNFIPERYVTMSDGGGNILRIRQNGNNWGYPYTYRLDKLMEDASTFSYHATSLFFEAGSRANWSTLTAGNNIRTLKSCPASGVSEKSANHANAEFIFNPLLPEDFIFTDEWINRIFKIITSGDDDTPPLGRCGTCMLQALEILLNFEKFQKDAPAASVPGLLFPSYEESGLKQFYDTYLELYDKVVLSQDNIGYLRMINRGDYQVSPYDPSVNRLFASMSLQNVMQPLLVGARVQAVLAESPRPPANRPYSSPYTAPTLVQDDFQDIAARMLQRPVGTVWFVSMALGTNNNGQYQVVAHANLMMRYRDGIGLIQTNSLGSELEEYKRVLNIRVTSYPELFSILTTQFAQPNKFYEVDFYEVVRAEQPMSFFDTVLSRLNCENTSKQGGQGYGSGEDDDVPSGLNLCGVAGERCVNYLYHEPVFSLPPLPSYGLSRRYKRELFTR